LLVLRCGCPVLIDPSKNPSICHLRFANSDLPLLQESRRLAANLRQNPHAKESIMKTQSVAAILLALTVFLPLKEGTARTPGQANSSEGR
jgi:hypothetical protein